MTGSTPAASTKIEPCPRRKHTLRLPTNSTLRHWELRSRLLVIYIRVAPGMKSRPGSGHAGEPPPGHNRGELDLRPHQDSDRFRVPHVDQLRGHFGFAAMCSDALRFAGIRSSRGFLGRFHGGNKSLRIPVAYAPSSNVVWISPGLL